MKKDTTGSIFMGLVHYFSPVLAAFTTLFPSQGVPTFKDNKHNTNRDKRPIPIIQPVASSNVLDLPTVVTQTREQFLEDLSDRIIKVRNLVEVYRLDEANSAQFNTAQIQLGFYMELDKASTKSPRPRLGDLVTAMHAIDDIAGRRTSNDVKSAAEKAQTTLQSLVKPAGKERSGP